MEKILKTTLLEYERSAFLIDLVKHTNGKQYVRIIQTIQDEESDQNRVIKINPSLLSDIVNVLNTFRELIPNIELAKTLNENKKLFKVLTDVEKAAIQTRYLKGVSIRELTMQFDCKKELIEQILTNNRIVIVDNNLSKANNYKKFRRRR